MTGLELLKSSSTLLSSTQLNKILGYDIDKSLEVFLSCYQLGQNGFLNAYRSFDGFRMPITFVEYKNSEIDLELRLSHFYNLHDLIDRWKENIKHDDVYQEYTLLPIAYTEVNLDHVFANPKDGGIFYFVNNQKMKLASNIFEFCLGLVETEILDEDFNNKTVYRNWSEDFWRTKEDEEIA